MILGCCNLELPYRFLGSTGIIQYSSAFGFPVTWHALSCWRFRRTVPPLLFLTACRISTSKDAFIIQRASLWMDARNASKRGMKPQNQGLWIIIHFGFCIVLLHVSKQSLSIWVTIPHAFESSQRWVRQNSPLPSSLKREPLPCRLCFQFSAEYNLEEYCVEFSHSLGPFSPFNCKVNERRRGRWLHYYGDVTCLEEGKHEALLLCLSDCLISRPSSPRASSKVKSPSSEES